MITTNLDRVPYNFSALVRNLGLVVALFVVLSPSFAQESVPKSEPAAAVESAEERSTDAEEVADPNAIWQDAEQLRKSGKYAEAAKRYGDVIQLQPNYAPAYVSKAECMNAIGELDIALQLADTAQQISGTRVPEFFTRAQSLKARILIEKGLYRDATDTIQSAIALDLRMPTSFS